MTQPSPPNLTYADAGVDIDAGNAMVERIKPLVRATRRPGADAEIGGFGGLFDLKAAGFRDPVLVAANDGVGTKVKIAIESGIFDTIGVDLVAMCVNDIVVQGAEPLFFLDYYATGRLDPVVGAAIVAGIANACVESGCALIGGETAEMPGLYAQGDFDLAGFAVGAAERGTLLPRAGLKAGDLAIGLPSSGVHSNGFSLVRRIVALSGLAWDAPAPFAPERSLAAALLEPTRLYVKPLLATLKATRGVKALAHVTGGGFPDNLPRVLPDDLAVALDLAAFSAPPVFSWLAATGGVSEAEMLRTFNCGFGMVAFVAAEAADEAMRALSANGLAPTPIGRLVAARGRARRHARAAEAVTERARVAILISGRGSNMAALIEAARAPDFPAANRARPLQQARRRRPRTGAPGGNRDGGRRVPRLSRPRGVRGGDAAAAERASHRARLPRRLHAHLERALRRALARANAQYPSLAAAGLRGLHTHERALAEGLSEHGCTVHFVEPELDAGPIVAQARVAVLPGDDADALAARVLVEEHKLYPAALAQVAAGLVAARAIDKARVTASAAPLAHLASTRFCHTIA